MTHRLLQVMLCAALVIPAADVRGADRRPYRVGVILPLSGQVASLGHYVRRGVELAIEELPAAEREGVYYPWRRQIRSWLFAGMV